MTLDRSDDIQITVAWFYLAMALEHPQFVDDALMHL